MATVHKCTKDKGRGGCGEKGNPRALLVGIWTGAALWEAPEGCRVGLGLGQFVSFPRKLLPNGKYVA